MENVLTTTEIITTEMTTISLFTAQTDHNTTTVLLLRIIVFLIVVIFLGLGCFLFSKRHKIFMMKNHDEIHDEIIMMK